MENAVLLSWYKEMGVDEAIAELSTNHHVQEKLKNPATNSPAAVKPELQKLESPILLEGLHEIIEQAKKLAAQCKTIDALKEAVMNFDGCTLKKTATNTVFADGNPNSEVMLIGEAPGAQEDKQGIPFCGDSGKLLDQILASIGLDRKENVYITNSLFWRPPGNRRPTQEELSICAPFVERHIALAQPKLLILAGGISASSILNIQQGITRLRGKFYDYSDKLNETTIPTIAVFHPSYLLRQPSQKRLVWQDMLKIKAKLSTLL